MRILIAILHHWNPAGNGRHQSLRADPAPRLEALRQQILGFSRLGRNQFHIHLADQAAYAANLDQRPSLDLHLITDGQHHLVEALDEPFRRRIHHVATSPEDPLKLGFEVQRHLADQLSENYDLYAYFEDDLIIHDPFFFEKIRGFVDRFGADHVLLPQRFESLSIPAHIDKLYVDGTMAEAALAPFALHQQPELMLDQPMQPPLRFEPPQNPHAGCFVLTHDQLAHWVQQPWWLDQDCSFVSPLESAATLGLLKTFRLYKPVFAQAAWLEAQHWGVTFLSRMAHATTTRPAQDA